MREFPVEARHRLLLAIGDHEKSQRIRRIDVRLIDPVIPPPLQLDDVVLLQGPQPRIADHRRLGLRVGVDEVLHFVVLLEFLLGDEVVEFIQHRRDVLGHVREPRKLALGGFDVTARDEYPLETSLDFGQLDDSFKRGGDFVIDGRG